MTTSMRPRRPAVFAWICPPRGFWVYKREFGMVVSRRALEIFPTFLSSSLFEQVGMIFVKKKSDFAIFFVETRNHQIFLTPACRLIFFPLRKFTADGSMSRNFRRSQGDWEVCNSCWILPGVEDTGGGFPCPVWESVVFFFVRPTVVKGHF